MKNFKVFVRVVENAQKKLLTGFHLVFEKFLLQKNICLYPETVLRNRQIKSAPYNNIVNHDYTKILKSDWLSTVLIYNHAMRSSDFVNHSYDYRPNWTPLSPVTITNSPFTSKGNRICLLNYSISISDLIYHHKGTKIMNTYRVFTFYLHFPHLCFLRVCSAWLVMSNKPVKKKYCLCSNIYSLTISC